MHGKSLYPVGCQRSITSSKIILCLQNMPTILNFHILKKYPIIFFKFPNKYVSGSHVVNLASQIVYGVKSNLG